jgi:hypothetical protein
MTKLILLLTASSLFAQTPLPRVVTTDPRALSELRAANRDAALPPALQKIKGDADRALKQEPVSVTQQPTTPPSGDKHDYMSMAPYFWPNPNTPDHLPYVRRDGERNPEINQIPNHRNFSTVMSTVYDLGLGYYFFGDERYAAKAAELLRVWFLDPATRMNPNLQYAQAIRGVNTGRGIGLIETASIGKIVDGVGLLAGSRSWTAADQRGLEDWFTKFLAWMQESENGKAESNAKNNHGTYYDVQIISLALFTGKTDVARRVVEQVKTKRIAAQIEPDGRMPLELARTKSWGYSLMNLRGFFQLAALGDRVGVNLWDFKTRDGRCIRAALDYLLPFALGDKKWTTQQIEPMNPEGLAPLLLEASRHFDQPRYREAALKLDPAVTNGMTAALLDHFEQPHPAAAK